MTNQNNDNHALRETKYQLAGWILFIVCAVFFLAASIKNGDVLTLIGCIAFLIACIIFMVPLLHNKRK